MGWKYIVQVPALRYFLYVTHRCYSVRRPYASKIRSGGNAALVACLLVSIILLTRPDWLGNESSTFGCHFQPQDP